MKKVLLVALTSILATSSIIINNANADIGDNNLYIKLEAGASKFNRIKDKIFDIKLKSKTVANAGIGFGGYINDKFRVDLTVNHVFNPIFKNSTTRTLPTEIKRNKDVLNVANVGNSISTASLVKNLNINAAVAPYYSEAIQTTLTNLVNNPDSIATLNQSVIDSLTDIAKTDGLTAAQTSVLINVYKNNLNFLQNSSDKNLVAIYNLLNTDLKDIRVSSSIKRKSNIESLMLNGYFDFAEFNNFKFFAGAGVGLALLREKISGSFEVTANNKILWSESSSGKTKIAKNFAYALVLGASAKVTDNTHAEVSYLWKDFGKTKSAKFRGIEVGKVAYRSHTISAGLRFDI